MDARRALSLILFAFLAGCSSPAPDDGGQDAPPLTSQPPRMSQPAVEQTGPRTYTQSWDGEYTGAAAQVELPDGTILCNTGASSVNPPKLQFPVDANATRLEIVMVWDNTVPQGLYLSVYDADLVEHKLTLASPLDEGRLEFVAESPAAGTWLVVHCVEGAAAMATFHTDAIATYV